MTWIHGKARADLVASLAVAAGVVVVLALAAAARATEPAPAPASEERPGALPILEGWSGASEPAAPLLTPASAEPETDAAPLRAVPEPLRPVPELKPAPLEEQPEKQPVLIPAPLATADHDPAEAEDEPRLIPMPLPDSKQVAEAAPDPAAPDSCAIASDFAHFAPALTESIDELTSHASTQAWAAELASLIRRLHADLLNDEPTAEERIAAVERHIASASSLVARLSNYELACRVQRTRLATSRRIPVWRYVVDRRDPTLEGPATVALRPVSRATPQSEEPADLATAIADVARMTGESPEGARWRRYLMLPQLQGLANPSDGIRALPPDDEAQRLLVLATLQRLRSPELTAAQRAFLDNAPFARFEAALVATHRPSVSPERLLADLERFEASRGTSAHADRLVADAIELRLSSDEADRRFAGFLETHYRNANVRFVVSEALLNRLVPPRPTEYARVRDRIAGQPVEGHRWTDTTVQFRTIPDPTRLLLSLDVNGTVSASTSSTSLAATFVNQSRSAYAGSKQIRIDIDGIHLSPATLKVDNELRLQSVRTSLDPIPLIGSLAGELARSEHRRARAQVSQEVKQKVYREAKREIDGEADTRFGLLNERLSARFLRPVANMGLGPVVIQNSTTESELVARWRIGTETQLGSHTPRPCPPPDSVASCQVHETALNNVIRRLELDGRIFTVGQLKRHLAARLNRPEWLGGETENDDVEIAFAPRDAVRIEFVEGKIRLDLAIIRLRRGAHRWKNFRIRVFFEPAVDGLEASLQRDGVVHLIGAGSPRSQIALRGIFGKIFPSETPVPVTPAAMVADTRLAGLRVSQFLLGDGWLSLALSPAQPIGIAQRR